MNLNRICSMLLVSFLMIAILGCGPDEGMEKIKEQNATNIQKMSNAYKLYAYVHGHVGPKTKEEFKQFLASNNAIVPNLELIGIDRENLDSYFISEADGQELLFRWGVPISPELAIDPIVFDAVGVDGVRRIMLACDVMLEVDDDEKYTRLLAGKVDRKNDVPASVFGTGVDEAEEAEVNHP